MSKHLQRELDQLRDELLSLFGIVEQMIGQAFRALRDRRPDLARQVIETDQAVDEREVHIEEECLKLLALHQPVASDLRWLTMVIKINSDLERIADLGCNIAERAEALHHFPLFPIPEDLQVMVQEASAMVRQALDAFVDSDAALARRVIAADDNVDALNRKMIGELQERMKESPENVEPALHCFSATRHLERIADLAENLAEDVIFMAEGAIVRHRHHEIK
ncbi:phosphate signaling complex protein PhoU [Candidatus Laterigemmans baculatus]|uniref:phosphate signaling complex protein PhoU n=1 Tax=Candidatus Laterigemmans baculatus TaxID=2770505 RepID=UPI0013DC0669|nr:phosphate signaling complex protein PhoU [Candidatus Laterigemmans baculatus]